MSAWGSARLQSLHALVRIEEQRVQTGVDGVAVEGSLALVELGES